ncbi:PAS domain-containing sensor histidine kinase [Hymenobacter cellulosivorans]|uniref:histidine kinase n=1 Tax=Hymenobacter cellulosivorans TaxID=2932249 RepID=A0ABY4F4K8_9BACT|nr:PAS domain-containing sensor histidine kinase [Hymenobacter cellulosivorans]UOQ51595.1 PAS domain-containing sensor histidine kinase [Hymenobacter cellulosivorans]
MPFASSFPAAAQFAADSLLPALLDLAPNGLVLCTPVYDATGGVVQDLALAYLNPVAQALLGLPAQPADTFARQFPGSAAEGSWAALHDAFLSGESGPFALSLAAPGVRQPLPAVGQRVDGGLLLSLTAPHAPAAVTSAESLRLEERSRQLERFDTVLEGLQEFVYLFDLEGRFRYVNKPLLNLWGLTLEQALGKNFFDLDYPPELAAQLQAQIQQAAASGQPVTGETPYTSPGGETGYYEYAFVPLLGADGAVEAVGGRTQPRTEYRRAAAALRESEAKYRALFDSIDEGFCLIEVLFENEQHPVDYRFLEINPAFERQTGLVAATGRTIRELAPGFEQHWFDIYGAVALSGKPTRFEQRAEQLHRWYDVYAFRVGEPGQHQVAVLFNDISQRRQVEEALRQSEQQQAFLLQLSDQLRPLSDPADIQYQAACALGQYLGASRVGYAEDQGDNAHIVVMRNYTQAGVPSLEGRYHYDDYGPELLQAFHEGRTVVRPDIAHDPTLSAEEKQAHAALQLGATVNVPLLKDGQLMAVLFMHYPQAHAWTDYELALLQETAERTWDAVVRARTEAALRESEERFRIMADAVPQIVWITDGEGRTEFFNRQWSRYTGVPYEPSTAAEVSAGFVHPADGPRTVQAFEEARRTGSVFQVEHRIRAADGAYRWFLVRAEPFQDPISGQITRWFGSSVDIHDRRQVEEALLRSEERLQKALSIDTVGILFFDLEGRIHDSNAAFERMSGYAHAELASGQVSLSTLTSPEFLPLTQKSLHELRTTGESTPLEKQYQRPDGSRWWGLFSGKRLSETECVKFVLDITEAKRAEEALRRSEQQLQHSNKQLTRTNQDLDNFVYAASHDLKQPVNNLGGLFAELYRSIRFTDPEEEQILVPLIQQGLQQLGSTIDELAALGQAQQAGEVPAETVALTELTEEVLSLLEPQIRAARARITTDFAAYPTVSFPRVNLRTVLLNLLSNSLKYADPARPARIHVSVWVDGGLPVLVVEDNGLGFDAQKYGEELFHLFRRLHRHTAGSGVGLYLVNRIVQANGGRIEVDSQEGEGATFRVWLGQPPQGQ